MRLAFLLGISALLFTACKRQFAEPTYAASGTAARVWFKPVAFYRPVAEIFIDSTSIWRTFISFPLVYDNDPTKYGFGNVYNPGKGTNALYMNTIYGSLPGGISSDSGTYNTTIPKCFNFKAEAPGAKKGIVEVIEQKVRLTRRDKTSYLIGISGAGTYDETTQLMEVTVFFDETAIGGPGKVARRYRFKP